MSSNSLAFYIKKQQYHNTFVAITHCFTFHIVWVRRGSSIARREQMDKWECECWMAREARTKSLQAPDCQVGIRHSQRAIKEPLLFLFTPSSEAICKCDTAEAVSFGPSGLTSLIPMLGPFVWHFWLVLHSGKYLQPRGSTEDFI